MSVELQEQRVRYVGNGTAKNFPFGFTIEEPSQVQVVRADAKGTETHLVLNQDYSVALNSDGTGSVTLTQPLPTDYVLALVSNIEIDQERAFYNNTPYYQEQIEGGLDKLTRICQQLHELATRHLTVPATSSTKPNELLAEIFTAQHESIESAASAASSAAAAGASEQGAASYLTQTQQAKTEAVAAIQAQQSVSESAVEQAGDAQAVRLEQLASNILVSGTAYNKEATVTLDQPITEGTVVSLPVADDGQQMMYRVGASTLRMGFNGTLLFEGEQFEEVGNTGTISTSVKLLFDVEAGDVLNFFVYSQNVTVVVDEESGLSIDGQKRLSAAGIKAVADAAQSRAEAALPRAGGTMSGSLMFDDNSGVEYSPQPYKGIKIFSAQTTVRLLDSDSEQYPSYILLQTPEQLTAIDPYGGIFSNGYSVLISINGYGAIDKTGACKLPVGIPTTQYVDVNSAAVFTAPADGFIIFTGTVNSTAASRIAMSVVGTALYAVNNTTSFLAGNPISCWLPVQRGMLVSFEAYNVTPTVSRFYYSLGAI